MSSVTSTDGSVFRPWHFFVVLTLLAATAAVLTSPKVAPEQLVVLSMTVFAAGAVALAAYRTLVPLVGRERRLLGESLGHRERAALEREKQLVLRSIKELEFDRAMGKLAPEDFDEMSRRLRVRALGLMQQLDTDSPAPRARLERELDERLRERSDERQPARSGDGGRASSASASASVLAPESELESASESGAESESADGPVLVDVLTGPDAIRGGQVGSATLACEACGVSNDLDARFCKSCGTRLSAGRGPSSLPPSAGVVTSVALAIALGLVGGAGVGGAGIGVAHAQMPDLSRMSGQPLPSGDLPAGTVSVRVVRGGMTNNVEGVDVELQGGPKTIVQKTDANGRAMFSGLLTSQPWRATTTVDGERLTSQEFTLPSAGGVRLLLVAGLKAGGAAGTGARTGAGAAAGAGDGGAGGGAVAAPAAPGPVTIGPQARVVIELGEQSVEVYGLFDVMNVTPAPVMPAQPIVFALPAEARGVTMLEGSSPQAKADGTRVIVSGPFPPGSTSVQIAYRYGYSGDTLRLSQVLPLRLPQTTVIVRKVGALQLQLGNGQSQREVPLEGRTYLVTNGGALEAGTPLDVTLRGLPHHPVWPRYTAIGLALVITIGGLLLALRARPAAAADDAEVRALKTRRAALFDQLLSLEQRRRTSGAPHDDPKLLARREALLADLEAVDDSLGDAVDDSLDDALAETPDDAHTGDAAAASSDQVSSSDQRANQLGARPAVR